MASITARKRADGSTVYKAEIVIKRHGVIAHRESKTFAKAKLARDWAMRREVELQENSVYGKRDFLSVREVVETYIKEFPAHGRSKRNELNALAGREIGNLNAHTLTDKDLIKHIRDRNKECKPQTANNDLMWLGKVFRTMKGVIDIDINMDIFDSARQILKEERLIGKSVRRDRRPTRAEIWALSRYFHGKWMFHVMWFALYSARRQEEITRIRWDDIRVSDRTCLIRNLKDPRDRDLTKRCKIPLSAYKIIMRQPRVSQYVFPRNSKTVGNNFTDACKMLGIKDLHFHDLRHEATSRLFERGLSIPQVQQVTLHSSWNTLKRYSNLNPGDLDI